MGESKHNTKVLCFDSPTRYVLIFDIVITHNGDEPLKYYKHPYIYYTSLSWDSENIHEDDFSGSDDNFLGFYDE